MKVGSILLSVGEIPGLILVGMREYSQVRMPMIENLTKINLMKETKQEDIHGPTFMRQDLVTRDRE
jgi:hypothetical protein